MNATKRVIEQFMSSKTGGIDDGTKGGKLIVDGTEGDKTRVIGKTGLIDSTHTM